MARSDGKRRARPPPEELINSYVKLQTAAGKIAGGLGVLALLWSTVVLLGGFVGDLRLKDFWFLTVLSFLMASKFVNIYIEEFVDKMYVGKAPLYMEGARMLRLIRRQKWIDEDTTSACKLVLGALLVPTLILLLCFSLVAPFSPVVALGLSVERLVRRNYGDAGGDAERRAKLSASLDLFYVLVLVQSIFAFPWVCMISNGDDVASLAEKRFGSKTETWVSKVGKMYYSETARKLKTDGDLPDKWNLITYAVGLLQSAASGGDDHLWGARVLDKLFVKDDASVRRQLLSSRVAIQNLICMIGRRGTDNIENRERATRILAHLARDLQITHFPGTLECICSLLDSCKQYSDKKGQYVRSLLETSQQHQDDAHMVVPIKDQTDHGHEQQLVTCSPAAGLAKRIASVRKYFEHRGRPKKDSKEKRRTRSSVYESIGAKELISQALLILEGLTRDKVNCARISRHQALLSKITAPLSLSSHDFLRNMQDKKTDEVLSKSLTVVSRLLTSPGDGATRLHQELATGTEAVSNLMAILETDSGGAQELHEQALEILTELAFDDSFTKPALGVRSTCMLNKLFKDLLRIFLEEDSHTIAAESDREKATRLRGKAGEALARLLLVRTARDANAAHILHKQEAIHLLTKALNQILSSKMGTTTNAVKTAVSRSVTEMEDLLTEVINQILCSDVRTIADAVRMAFTRNENLSTKVIDKMLSRKMGPRLVGILRPLILGIKKQYDERKFLAAILSVAVVICNENVISKEDFARAIPEDAALVEKLMEILKLNKHSTAECLRVVKLTCRVVIAMIQVKPSCIAHFNEHNFQEELTEALETMSVVDDCMLFAGNGRDEVIKPARSLVSLVEEVHELLNTQHKNMVNW